MFGMRLIGILFAALAVAMAGCAPASGGKAATPTLTSHRHVPPGQGTGDPGGTSEPTPTPGPVVTPQARGSGWRYAYISEQPDSELVDVAAAGPREAWAVGTAAGGILLLRHDGRRWRQVDPPAGMSRVSSGIGVHVAASAPDNVWLLAPKDRGVEQAAGMVAFRWNGSRWRKIPGELDTGDADDFEVLGPDDAWTVDGFEQPFARHWDGRAWRTMRLPADAESLSGTSPGDLWAVGTRHSGPAVTDDELSQPAAMHWNGRAWRLVPTPTYAFDRPKPPEGSAGLDAVVALSRDNVWAVGEHTFNHGEVENEPNDPPPILLHWDGGRWTKHPAPGFRYCCPELVGAGNGEILLATGSPGFRDTWRVGAVGQRTRLARLPAIPGLAHSEETQYFAMAALDNTPRGGTVWAAGQLAADGGYWSRAVIVRYG